jgi:hypothetical protein
MLEEVKLRDCQDRLLSRGSEGGDEASEDLVLSRLRCYWIVPTIEIE